jgi:hypothetical protein
MTQYAVYMYYLKDPGTIIYYEVFEAENDEAADRKKDVILVDWCWRRNLDNDSTVGATIFFASNTRKILLEKVLG